MQPISLGAGDIAPTAPSLLSVVGVTKAFGMTKALRGATFDVQQGSIHCLLGENGAGKSTIGKIVGGLYRADSGKLSFDGKEIAPASIAEARALGIAIVFQELSLAPHLTVAENICLGNEGRIGFANRDREVRQCRALLESLGLVDLNLNQPVGQLPPAQQQLIEIAKALVTNPNLIILDEPTAMLSAGEKGRLFEVLRNLRTAGKTFIFVTHHLDEVIELGDFITILRDGVVVNSFEMESDLSPDDVLNRMGSIRSAAVKREEPSSLTEPFMSIRLSGERSRFPIEIREGEIVGLYGVVGCGREEIVAAVSGIRQLPLAELTLDGGEYAPQNTSAAVRQGIGYLPTGRAANGIFPSLSIRDNLTIGQLTRFSRAGFINSRRERQEAEVQLSALKTRMRSANDRITSLSGGNQQKVLLGRCLKTGKRLLVLEDPTAGIDLAAKSEIHTIIRSHVANGTSVLLTSSDLPETLSLCDRVYTLFGGAVVGCYSGTLSEYEDTVISDILGNYQRKISDVRRDHEYPR